MKYKIYLIQLARVKNGTRTATRSEGHRGGGGGHGEEEEEEVRGRQGIHKEERNL